MLIANVLTSDTGIAMGLVGSVIVSAVICTWWISNRISKIDSAFVTLGKRLEAIEQRELDNYTMTQAEVHALRTAIANPHMRVPDPRDPSRIIVTTPEDHG